MPLPDAIAAAEAFKRKLLSRERQVATRLVNAYGQVYSRLQSQIEALIADLDRLTASGETPKAWQVGRLERLKALRRQIESEVTRYGAVLEAEINQGAQTAIAQAQRDAQALTQAALPGFAQVDAQIMAQWQRLNPQAVESMMGFLSPDSPIRAYWVKQYGVDVADVVERKLIEAITLGYNPRRVATAIRDAMGEGLNSALRLARTTQLYAYREATRASYIANAAIVPKWRWQSARDDRVCMSCLAMDGTVHPLTERLNDHWNGRCVMVPVPITYRDLGYDVDEPPSPLEHPTGEAWFRSLSPAQQQEMMGQGLHDAWQSGKVRFADLSVEDTDRVFGKMRRQTTLKELLADATAAA